MRKNFDNRLMVFTLLLLVGIICSLVFDSFGQGSALVRSCAGTGLTTKTAKLEVTKDGDINIIPCDSRSVLLRGSVLNGSGTVQSVGLTLPNIFTVSGSPITTSGTFTATLANQTQNLIFASPNGSTGAPTFRALVNGDIPNLDAAKITTGVFSTSIIPNLDAAKITSGTFDTARIPNLDAAKITTGVFSTSAIPNLDASKVTSGTISTARLGSGTADNTTFLRGDNSWATIDTSKVTYELISTNSTLIQAQSSKVIELRNATVTLPTSPEIGTYYHFVTDAFYGVGAIQFPASTTFIRPGVTSSNGATSKWNITNGTCTMVYVGSGRWYLLNTYGTQSYTA